MVRIILCVDGCFGLVVDHCCLLFHVDVVDDVYLCVVKFGFVRFTASVSLFLEDVKNR
jgi:hypothetical protein